jgi:hypothetical protein
MKQKLDFDWSDEINNAITICNPEGIIIYMNSKSIEDYTKYGGDQLLGKNLLDCHSEPSKSILKDFTQE